MAAQFKLDVKGIKQLDKALKQLGPKVGGRILKKSLRAGARIIRNRARQNVPVLSGNLRKAIRVRTARSRRKGTANIQVSIGDRWFSGKQFYGAFVEFGHRVGSRSLGASRKQVAPVAFIGRAFDETKIQALSKIQSELGKNIEAEFRKLAPK